MRPVLVHGDFHPNNIFWHLNEDGSCSSRLRAIIDWQMFHSGNAGEDFARLLLCSPPATRREAELTLFDTYYEVLKHELAAKGLQVPFPKEKVISAYKRAFVGQLLFILSALKVLLEKEANVSKEMARVQRARLASVQQNMRLNIEDAILYLQEEAPRWIKQT